MGGSSKSHLRISRSRSVFLMGQFW